jgi:hypothetical protein
VGADAISCCPETIVDPPGFTVLAAGEYGGELEHLVETTSAEEPGTGSTADGQRQPPTTVAGSALVTLAPQ